MYMYFNCCKSSNYRIFKNEIDFTVINFFADFLRFCLHGHLGNDLFLRIYTASV